MKTIEQKAKAYDEAYKRATIRFGTNVADEIFPELAESEDERIRDALVAMVTQNVRNGYETFKGVKNSEMFAWLEKQSKETSWKPSKEEMDVLYGLAYITNQYDEHKEEVITRLYQDLKREFFNGSSYENMFPNTEDGVRRRSTIQVLEYARSLDAYNQYGKEDIDKNIAWLEKQGEKKLDPRYSIFDKLIEADDIYQMSVNESMIAEARNKAISALSSLEISKLLGLEKQGEQKPQGKSALEAINEEKVDNANKVESKFKPGDWIACEELNTAHIINIQDDRYEVEFIDGNKGFPHINYIDRNYHLWTIQDAKDGDVLVCEGEIFMLKSFALWHKIIYHCCYDGRLRVHSIYESLKKEDFEKIVPATKEQRDLLFQKMREAGYEWDGENKELKKINYFTAEYERGKADALKSVAWSEEVNLEKESLTWKDIRELYIIFAEVDAEIEFCKAGIQVETIGYYQEVLKRFKAQKGE